ncbi:MAG: hypothetical protein KGI37_05775 [Alphaproteobacteria bacterium]|nr:hypothetical protein [Alphaproteobacteria bacterium]
MRKYLLLAVALVLAACADDSGSADQGGAAHDKDDKKAQAEIAPPICPQVAILIEAQRKADYGREQPDPSQLVATAQMQNVDGDCSYQDNGIDIKYTLHMTARRGPRLGGGHDEFPYFVAIVDPADRIISRQILTASFTFSDGSDTATDDEPLHVFIPLAKTAQLGGPDYRVLAGFQK